MPIKKSAPRRPAIQWRWIIKPREYASVVEQHSIDLGTIDATSMAKAHSRDNLVDMRYVKGTGVDGRISKADVVGYIALGKPIPQLTELRMPKIREIIEEGRNAKMHVAVLLGFNAFWLWEAIELEDVVGGKKPVYTIEWGFRGARGPATRLKNRDGRFGLLPARATNPWGAFWGPQT